ncbi:hypothetical protein Tco_1413180 [Tanacetum coccineum]
MSRGTTWQLTWIMKPWHGSNMGPLRVKLCTHSLTAVLVHSFINMHHSLLRFKLNGKSYTINVDNFRDMLKIYPKLPGQIFEEPPLEEEILSFIKNLGHTGEIKTQVYGAILPQHLTNQAMLESKAYMTYRAYATGEKTPKPKTTKKKNDSESSPMTKSTQASKGKRIMTLAKGDKLAKKKQSATKSKGLTVLSESNVPDEQQQNISGINKGAGDKPEVPDVPKYRSESEEES